MDAGEAQTIGARARMVRRRRGLSLDLVAGLAGITKQYLSLPANAHAHLDEAAHIASRVGERNGMRQHFGPTNVAAWRVSIGVELAEGAKVYEDVTAAPTDIAALGSRERSSSLHFDLARVLAQEDGPRDADVIRHLDTADRIAPQRIRSDPIALDLARTLDRRAERRCGSSTACSTVSVSAARVNGV